MLIDAGTLQEISTAEAENIVAAQRKHLSRPKASVGAWLDESFIRKLHGDMFGEVWEWAGKYKSADQNLGVSKSQVPEAVAKLCGDVRFWEENKTFGPFDRAVRIHHRLAQIHPFRNGNGRHARMTSDIYLFSLGHPLPNWPSNLNKDGTRRDEYLKALKAADGGDYGPLLDWTKRLLPPPKTST